MNIKKINISEFSQDEFDILKLVLNTQAFQVLGIHWTKYVEWYTEFQYGNIVFMYE